MYNRLGRLHTKGIICGKGDIAEIKKNRCSGDEGD